VQYKDFVKLAPRFTRAIDLERDATVPAAVDGYIVTTTAEDVLGRLVRALADPAGHRAWTLTGPYGSGKSAFALYLANLLGPLRNPGSSLAHSILRAQREGIYREVFDRRKKNSLPRQGFCPVLIRGSQEPLLGALLRACLRDIRLYYARGRPPAALKDLTRHYAHLQNGRAVQVSAVIEGLIDIALRLQESGRSQGILLVIDELGKFLEFAGRESDRSDIYILQQLAEATARFKSPGLYLLTILHQSFERYAAGLRPAVRDEWSKVQGRFEDVAFQEPPEQMLDILAQAISHGSHPLADSLRGRARSLAEVGFRLGLAPQGLPKRQFVEAMSRCAPLHPLVVLALIRLCRKFGQNQRSLFAFLVSREPHGFSNFLQQEVSKAQLPFYGLANLYDYVAQALGNALTIGENATRWAEVQSALDRCRSSPADELQLIKAVGVLSAIGAYGDLKPSREVIDFAFEWDREAVRRVRAALLHRSVLVYRKHSQSFAFWEGSDVDLDSRIGEAKRRITEGMSLAQRLNGLWAPRPLVAKRHSFQSGTLRYFSVRFAGVAEFSKAVEPDPDADGLLIYCLPTTQAEFEQLVELAKTSGVRDRSDILVAIPREVDALREAVRELGLLRWVETNTAELKGDPVARRELRARLAAAEEQVSREIQSLFSPGDAAGLNTLWFHRGIPQAIPSALSLAHLLSDVCDVVYAYTPQLRNELINRRDLSSAAAKARRNLIDAMIAHGCEERLGLTGNPPAMSMYVSILGATKLHRREGAAYVFGPPQGDKGLAHLWKAIDNFLAGCELQRRSVAELFSILEKPPFGLKMGLIPVLFCASLLSHDTEIALYENEAFIPELTVDVFERLLRSPEKFDLRRYRIVGVRKEVFRHFAELLGTPSLTKSQDLVAIVRPLYRFFSRLPEYSRQTRAISQTAQTVREALLGAREPDTLLFEDLPRACGVPPFLPSDAKAQRIAAFFRALRGALVELQRAYDDLLAELLQLLFQAFNTSGSAGREVLRFRAQATAEHAVEPRLRAFALHLCDDQLQDVAWIEAIAALLVGKTPRTWSDADRARYEVMLVELVRSFRHIEALVFGLTNREKTSQVPAEVLRIGVTDRHSKEREAVVIVEVTDQHKVAEAVIRVEESLDRLGIATNPELALAALGTVSRRFLSELERSIAPAKLPNPEEVAHE